MSRRVSINGDKLEVTEPYSEKTSENRVKRLLVVGGIEGQCEAPLSRKHKDNGLST